MSLISTSIKRPVAVSMGFLILIVLGIAGFRYLPVDLLPPIEYPQLTVSTEYPYVGSEEVEQIITQRIENALAGIPGVERMRSNSSEGRSRVTLEFSREVDVDVAANDVRAALDRLRDEFPPEVIPPQIWKFDPNNFPIVIVGASSDMPLDQLTQTLEREVTKQFEQIPGVGSIDVWGGVYREVHIDLKRDKLMATGLTANQVQQALVTENANLPGGNVNSGVKRLYVRTLGEFKDLEQVKNTVVTIRNNRPVRVRDVADVSFGYQDLNRMVTIQDKPMVRFGIRKQTGANTVAVANDIRKEIERLNLLRSDMKLFVTTDQSEFIQSSIDNVKNSAFWGALFAVFILYLFLRNGSSTFIIALSIPISIIATFALLYFSGLTLNQMSFGGLALGVGMIVDNAIVVLENIVRSRQRGNSLPVAAEQGAKQVSGAIIASTLTTSVIFLPVVFMQTISGSLYQELAIVVVFALICSLLVALTLVPMLSSKLLTVRPTTKQTKSTVLSRFFDRLDEQYASILSGALNHRKKVAGLTILALIASISFFPNIPIELAPQTDADEIDVDIQMAEGTNITVLNSYLHELETIVKEHLPMDDVKFFTTDVRDGRAEVEIAMKPASERSMKTSDIADLLREKVTGVIPGADIRVDAQSGLWILRRVFGSGGTEDIQIELRGYNLDRSYQIAQELKSKIEVIPGIQGVRLGRREGRPEQNYIFDREKIAQLGLTVREVSQIIQTNIGGSRAGAYRVEGEEYPIIVRLRPKDRLTAEDLDNISIQTPSGQVVPISAVVQKQLGRGPTDINRINSQRTTFITANLESGIPLSQAVERIQAQIADYPLPSGYSILFGGEYEEQEKAASDFRLSIMMALILIYMVMAGQFERFVDPLVVMFSVPLAIIGIVPTMLLTGTTINIQSLMGMIMLVGIVVNNAIVLVDYINIMRREERLPLLQAVIEAGKLRLRPILMTSLTTILGLLPLAFGIGPGAEIQASLARVVIGGLTASTLITLVFIPIVYVAGVGLTEKVTQWKNTLFTSEDSVIEPQNV